MTVVEKWSNPNFIRGTFASKADKWARISNKQDGYRADLKNVIAGVLIAGRGWKVAILQVPGTAERRSNKFTMVKSAVNQAGSWMGVKTQAI